MVKSTGYFFGATRKSPDMLYPEDTFGRTQILACAGPRKWPYPTTCWPKSSKRAIIKFFRFVRSNHLRRPVFWIYRSGGRPSWVVVQKSQNRNCSRFWQHRQNWPYWAGGQKRHKILRWFHFLWFLDLSNNINLKIFQSTIMQQFFAKYVLHVVVFSILQN